MEGAEWLRFDMDKPNVAMRQFEEVAGSTLSACRNGKNVLAHCMAGVHRGSFATSVLRAMLHNEPVEVASSVIQKIRAVDPGPVCRDFGEERIRKLENRGRKLADGPAHAGYVSSYQINAKVHAAVEAEYVRGVDGESSQRKMIPRCLWRQRKENVSFTAGNQAETVEEAADWGRAFCGDCFRQLLPPDKHRVSELFDMYKHC